MTTTERAGRAAAEPGLGAGVAGGAGTVRGRGWAVAALVVNAFVWGISWWPLRELQLQGLHPLWATAFIFAVGVLGVSLWQPAAWGPLLRRPALWLLALAAGLTSACFNWAVTVGDVVRVVLLFYLMPLWAVLLARLVLKEPLTRAAALRVLLALAGAGTVLWPAQGGFPLPSNLPEWMAVLGGFGFALNNVLLRREAAQPASARALAMFAGGAAVPCLMALAAAGTVPWPPAPAVGWVLLGLTLAIFVLASNLALQYGAARLPANVTAVVVVSEILFAAVSAVLLGAGQVTPQLALGGALIVGATLLSARD